MSLLGSLTEIFRDVFDQQSLVITLETSAADIEEWDSVGQVNLVLAIESLYGIRLTMTEATEIDTVGDFIEVIKRERTNL